NPPQRCLLLFGFGVELGEAQTRFEFACGLIEDGREAATRRAPWCPAIHQERNRRVLQHLFDIASSECDGLADEERVLAAPAAWTIVEALGRYAVGDVAEGASQRDEAHGAAP